ncbi:MULTISPECIES: polysaccharide pyruvyl transferase family protein [Halorubrum]|uniref:polysaccharide pyruvyl transferase family protein n=1 Tax=Halorubrum TaxID=56688 RepID=UPI0009B5C073|nr:MULTISPECIES: polysaccharide pyruvyl transferase family protein [Halorubrum]
MDVPDQAHMAFKKFQKGAILSQMQFRCLFKKSGISVIGSYASGNVGDKAIGKSIVDKLTNSGFDATYFSRYVRGINSPVRILGGGGVIHQYRRKKIERDFDLLNENSMIVGVGVSPVFDPELRELIRNKIKEVSLVTVRDQRSKQLLEDITDKEVHSLACPAFQLDTPNTTTQDYTGISLRPLPVKGISSEEEKNRIFRHQLKYNNSLSINEVKEKYQENIKNILTKIRNVKHIPFHHFDSDFVEDYDVESFPYAYDVNDTLRQVSNASRMICMRYHSLVFSILNNKPSLAIAYSPKVAKLANRADIPCFKPYEEIKLKFKQPSNRDTILSDSEQNFRLMNDQLSHSELRT